MEAQILHYQQQTPPNNESKLFCVTNHKNEHSHHLFFRRIKVGCYSGTTGLSHDEYVTIRDNNVVWSCGSRIIKSFALNPSITPNTDIPMTLRSATTMNVDTPVNYFRDNQYSLNANKHFSNEEDDNGEQSIFDKLPFVNDNIFDISSLLNGTHKFNSLHHSSSHSSKKAYNANPFRIENNENVNTDNCLNAFLIKHETDSDTTYNEEDSAMSLEEEDEDAKQSLLEEDIPQQTPPSMIKQDKVLCDDEDANDMAMDVDQVQMSKRMRRQHSFSGLSQDIHGINIKTPQREKDQRAQQQQQQKRRRESVESHSDCSQILDVVWCYFPHFPSNEPQRCLCLLQNENITIISLSGDICYVPLPCETESIWAMPEGLMIQAKQQNDIEDEQSYYYPILFSLLNPLEELRPISLHLLNANSKSLFFDEYYHEVALKLQCNVDSNTSPYPNSNANKVS